MRTLDQKRLLLIEDDQTISELLAYNLRKAGYEVLAERDGQAGLNAALSRDIDLALVDVMLPGLNGMAVSREIARLKPSVPIIMLTARGERESVIEGFRSGADDYVVKPFDLDELLARIAVRLRRAEPHPEVTPGTSSLTGISLDEDTHMLRTASGEVFLKPKEHDLLALLLSQPGHLFRREEITHRVWQQRYLSESRTLDVHIRHVRAKLEAINAPIVIQNVRGVGYRAASPGEKPTP